MRLLKDITAESMIKNRHCSLFTIGCKTKVIVGFAAVLESEGYL